MIYNNGKKWVLRCEFCENVIESDFKTFLEIEAKLKNWVWFLKKRVHIKKDQIKKAKRMCCNNCKTKNDIQLLKW